MSEMVNWYVLNAFKKELIAKERLENDGFTVFMPMHNVPITYHGKKLIKQKPLIPSLLFVRIDEDEVDGMLNELNSFKHRSGNEFIRYVTRRNVDGTVAKLYVRDNEMQEFMAVARHTEEELRYYQPEEIDLKKGDKVRIVGGVFHGCIGTLLKVKGCRSKRLVVSIKGLVSVAASYIAPEFIQKIK